MTHHQGLSPISNTLPLACLISSRASFGTLPSHGPSPKSATDGRLLHINPQRKSLAAHETLTCCSKDVLTGGTSRHDSRLVCSEILTQSKGRVGQSVGLVSTCSGIYSIEMISYWVGWGGRCDHNQISDEVYLCSQYPLQGFP